MEYDYKPTQPIEYYSSQIPEGARLFCLPFYRYAVQSPVPEVRKIDVFEKAVLGIRRVKMLTPGEIGQQLGLDKELIKLIVDRLTRKKILDDRGEITEFGIKVWLEEDPYLDVQNSKIATGYVYQNLLSGALFARFNKKVALAETRQKESAEFPKIRIRANRWELPVFCLIKEESRPPIPSSKDILEVVYRHGRALSFGKFDIDLEERPPDLDKVCLLDAPEFTWLVTAVYGRGNDDFAQVVDPFGLGTNAFLGDYLEEITRHNGFVEDQINTLVAASVQLDKTAFIQQKEELNKIAVGEITKQFGTSLNKSEALYKHLVKLERRYQYLKLSEEKGSIAKEAVVVFERIFKAMIENDTTAYSRIKNILRPSNSTAQKQLNKRIMTTAAENLGAELPLPYPILATNSAKVKAAIKYYETSGALTGMTAAAILAADNEEAHPLGRMLRENPSMIQDIQAFAQERNKDPAVHDRKNWVKKDAESLDLDRLIIYSIVKSFLPKN